MEPWQGTAHLERPGVMIQATRLGASGSSVQGPKRWFSRTRGKAILQDPPPPPERSTCSSSPDTISQGPHCVHPKADRSWLGRVGLGPLPSLAPSPSSAIRKSLRSPTAVVAAAVQGCQNQAPLASSGTWAMWGQGTDPQTHWLSRWSHRLELGTQNRSSLIAWKGKGSPSDHMRSRGHRHKS